LSLSTGSSIGTGLYFSEGQFYFFSATNSTKGFVVNDGIIYLLRQVISVWDPFRQLHGNPEHGVYFLTLFFVEKAPHVVDRLFAA
jgi:hypothetical protein